MKDQLKGNLKMIAGEIKKQWGKLTGIAKDETAKQVDQWKCKVKEGLGC